MSYITGAGSEMKSVFSDHSSEYAILPVKYAQRFFRSSSKNYAQRETYFLHLNARRKFITGIIVIEERF
jgi:hypothetical protein